MAHTRSESASTATSYATARSDTGSDYIERASDGGEPDYYGGTEEERTVKKLNQVIMQFFKKATLTVLSARTQLPPAFSRGGELRQSKWFSLLLDETDVYNEDLREWTTTDLVNTPPAPLCIEIYLDTKDLADGEALAIVDEHGKLWDVAEALNASTPLTTRPSSRSGRPTQVVLERWTIEVTENQKMDPDANRMLPLVYKNGIPLFRSLYTYTRFLPAWKYYRHIAKQPVTQPSLPLRYRISNGQFKSPRRDTLDLPLYPAADSVAQTHQFESVKSPTGLLNISVQYRSNTEFRVEKSESVLSSHFMGMDDYSFSPSYPERVPGSLPTGRNQHATGQGRGEAYGSLSTFHQAGATGTSPMSALRNAKDMGSPESPPQKMPPNHRTATGSKSSLRGVDAGPASPRRTSVSFQPANPFKAGSLSSSPVPGVYSPGTSLGRTQGSGQTQLGHTRNRSSLNALPQAALRTPSGHSLPNETAIASSASSSPKPAPISRYSSSFGNRKRFSSGGGSIKVEDDNNSSGKGSASSSAQRLEGGSSGSVQTDEENISDFLKLLEQKKDLKSLNRTDSASRDASMRRTTAALSRYQRMRESNAALSDSMSSSVQLHRSSSSSSRHLSNVPGMIAGASFSTSSSPGKPISPHTPHTPAIPSRLSANSIIDYSDQTRSRSPRNRRLEEETGPGDNGSDSTTREQGTNAIDIPTSPRPWAYVRRSSSVSQQQRNTLDEDNELFGLRSASLPTDDRPDLSLSELLHAGEPASPADAGSRSPGEGESGVQDTDASPQTVMNPVTGHIRTRSAGAARATTTAPSFAYRTRIQQGAAPSDGRRSAASERGDSDSGIVSGRSSRVGSRYSFSSRPLSVAANLDDDEPLLFTMSELGAQGGRRSVEEMRESGGKRRGGSPWRGA